MIQRGIFFICSREHQEQKYIRDLTSIATNTLNLLPTIAAGNISNCLRYSEEPQLVNSATQSKIFSKITGQYGFYSFSKKTLAPTTSRLARLTTGILYRRPNTTLRFLRFSRGLDNKRRSQHESAQHMTDEIHRFPPPADTNRK